MGERGIADMESLIDFSSKQLHFHVLAGLCRNLQVSLESSSSSSAASLLPFLAMSGLLQSNFFSTWPSSRSNPEHHTCTPLESLMGHSLPGAP